MRREAAGHRRDTNEPAVIDALRAAGASVEQLSGPGIPDLLVGFRGGTYLLEVKSAGGTLTPEQKTWHLEWRGFAVQVVWSPEDALKAIGLNPKRKG